MILNTKYPQSLEPTKSLNFEKSKNTTHRCQGNSTLVDRPLLDRKKNLKKFRIPFASN